MVDFDIRNNPTVIIAIIAHIGNIGTVSLGRKNNRDSLRVYSPPILAVTSISVTDDSPKTE